MIGGRTRKIAIVALIAGLSVGLAFVVLWGGNRLACFVRGHTADVSAGAAESGGGDPAVSDEAARAKGGTKGGTTDAPEQNDGG